MSDAIIVIVLGAFVLALFVAPPWGSTAEPNRKPDTLTPAIYTMIERLIVFWILAGIVFIWWGVFYIIMRILFNAAGLL